MKVRELPIYFDLLRLPPKVLFKRLKKRFNKTGVEAGTATVPDDFNFRNYKVPASFKVSTPEKHWTVILDHYLKNEFNLLGSGWTSILNQDKPSGFENWRYGSFPRPELAPEQPDWNRDQRTGFQFDLNLSPGEALKIAFGTDGVDVKFSWEFARMYHLPQLAIFYNCFPARQNEILNLWQQHIQTFQQQCASVNSIHWSSPMEVAIRLSNILISYSALKADLSQLEDEVLKMAHQHYQFIINNLEDKEGFGTNHYLSNLMGLVVASCYLDNMEVNAKGLWAWREFEKELKKQFFSDGFNFEYSTYYHRLSTEIAFVTFRHAILQDFDISPDSCKILGKAFQSIKLLEKNDVSLPQFGDNDSGRILDLNPEGYILNDNFHPQPQKHNFIHDIENPESLYGSFYKEVAEHISGVKLRQQLNIIPVTISESLDYISEWNIYFSEIDTEKIKIHYWEKAGIILYKSDEFYLALNLMANPSGHRYRGHMHNDKGSFELEVRGRNYTLDPGIYSYTAIVDLRNKYRCTAAHNVPYSGVEQNSFIDGPLGLFHMKLETKTSVVEISGNKISCLIQYKKIIHLREIRIYKDHIKIRDNLNRPFSQQEAKMKEAVYYGKLNE